jgi:integrase
MPHRHGTGWRGSIQVPGVGTYRQGGFTTKAAALRWERDTAADLERGTWRDPEAGSMLFEAWCKVWLDTRGTLETRSREAEESVVRIHLIPTFGKARLDQIGALAVETFVSQLVARKAPKTVRNIHGVLHSVFALAVRDGRLTANPCVGTRLPDNERRKVMACMTEQQLGHLAGSFDPHWRPLIRTLAGTGLRWGEAVGLRVQYVDLLVPELRVAGTLNTYATRYKPKPKTDSGRRTIGLPSFVVDELLPLVAGKAGEEYVFTMPDGSPIAHHKFNPIFLRACKQAGVRATIHDLRHSHAALLIANGVPMAAISRRLGHKSIDTTYKTYGYLLPRVEADLLAGLDRSLGDATGTSETAGTAQNGLEPTPAEP